MWGKHITIPHFSKVITNPNFEESSDDPISQLSRPTTTTGDSSLHSGSNVHTCALLQVKTDIMEASKAAAIVSPFIAGAPPGEVYIYISPSLHSSPRHSPYLPSLPIHSVPPAGHPAVCVEEANLAKIKTPPSLFCS
jgi:hypothetical protein